jgi:hypothetical protein
MSVLLLGHALFSTTKSKKQYSSVEHLVYLRGKAIPVTGREGPWGCERPRLPHFLDNRLTDGGKVVSCPYPQEASWYSFLLEAESTPRS